MSVFEAVKAGDVERARTLLHAGGDANEPGPGGRTPLIEAAQAGNLALVKVLLEARGDPSLKDDERESALLKAAAYGHREIVRLLAPHCPPEELELAKAFLTANASGPDALPPREPEADADSSDRWVATVAARAARFFGDESASARLDRLERAEKKKR